MTRVLITGGAGFSGRALIARAPAGYELHATQRNSPVAGASAHPADLAEAARVREVWERVRPELVFHTAYAMESGERDIWMATRNVVDACRATGAALVHLSTDLVFDGEHAPYDEQASPAPIHEYGRWKAHAEDYVRERAPAAAIVRTSLITSFSPPDPRSARVLAGLREEEPVTLFHDELRTPIGRDDLVTQLWEIAGLEPSARAGVWHLAGPEAVSRYALGLLVAASMRLPAAGIAPVSGRGAGAARPRDVRLSTERADRTLRARARPISTIAVETLLANAGAAG